MKNLSYSRQFIDKDDIEAVARVLKNDFLTCGPEVEKFEEELAKYCSAEYALVFNSGTAALHASYFAIGLSKDDEFITTPLTFAADANAGLYLGAKPIFVDIDLKTGNIDPKLIEKKITKRTKLIVPVHYSGQPVDLDEINKIAKKHKLFVIDDACHALGAKYKGSVIGNGKYSDATILSFHPVKHITTGEGGAILTNNIDIYNKAKQFRTHGITKDKNLFTNPEQGGWYNEMQFLGFNYRMPDILAGLGRSQLKKADRFIASRKKIARTYDRAFADNAFFDVLPEKLGNSHVYHLYPILIKDKYLKYKRQIFESLHQKGLGVQVHYLPIYLHPYYQYLGFEEGLCPVAEEFYKREISIPIFQMMSLADSQYVVKTINDIFLSLPIKVGIIIQARANSTRLPRKIFKKLPYGGSHTVLDQVIRRAKHSKSVSQIIVATSTAKENDKIEQIANKNKVKFFRGSESNVLDRYYQAAKKFDLDVIVRITGDCPCFDAGILDELIEIHLKNNQDITTNTRLRSFPRGLDVEIMNFEVLEKASNFELTKFEKEHVTHYFYHRGKNLFKVKNIEATGKLKRPDVRITLDTLEDYAFLSTIYSEFSDHNKEFTTSDILKLLDKKPWLLLINQKIAQEEIEWTTDQKNELGKK